MPISSEKLLRFAKTCSETAVKVGKGVAVLFPQLKPLCDVFERADRTGPPGYLVPLYMQLRRLDATLAASAHLPDNPYRREIRRQRNDCWAVYYALKDRR